MAGNEIEVDVKVDMDVQGLERGAARATQTAQRAGQDIASEMDRAATRAEQAFDGVGDGIGRRLADIPPPRFEDRIVPAAAQAGDKAGSAVVDGLLGADYDSVGGFVTSILEQSLGPAGPIVGKLFGEELAAGIDAGFSANKNRAIDSVKFGLSGAQMNDVGRSAGDAWGAGFGESLTDVRDTALLLENQLGQLDSSLDLSGATRDAQALADVFGIEVPAGVETARRLISTGLVGTTEEAYALMGDAAQKYGSQTEEILDVVSEFAPVFDKMGVDGKRAYNIIGTAVSEGLLPNVSRAGELFEEFNIEMTDGAGRARPVVQALGLDFEEMQSKLANGKGDEALAQISTALLSVGDEATRNQLALTLFGSSIESASDPERVLELLAQADAVGEVGTAMDDATAAVEENTSGWDKFKRTLGEVGAILGGNLSTSLGVVYDLLEGNPIDAVTNGWDGFMNSVHGVTDALGLTDGAARDTAEAFEENKRKAEENTDAVGANRSAQDELHVALGGTKANLDDAALAAAAATSEMEDLDAQFDQLTSKFDGDKAIRKVYEDLARLSELSVEATGDIYDTGSGFDQTTEAGRTYSAQLETLQGNLAVMAQGHRDGTVTALELTSAQRATEAQLRAVAAQLDLTEAETQDLINRYAQVPDDVRTQIDLEGNAFDRTRELVARLRGLDGYRATSFVDTYQTTVFRSRVAGGNGYSADGGPVKAAAGGGGGQLTMVNERGPEIARLPDGDMVELPYGTTVMTAEDSARIRGGGAGTTVINNITVMGSVHAEREIEGIVARGLRAGGIDSFRSG